MESKIEKSLPGLKIHKKLEDLDIKHFFSGKYCERRVFIKYNHDSVQLAQEIRALRKVGSVKYFPEMIFHNENLLILKLYGDDLQVTYKKKPIPMETVVRITRQILKALKYLHCKYKLVHLDIKPENICFASSRSVVLLDLENCKEVNSKTDKFAGTVVFCPMRLHDLLINRERIVVEGKHDMESLIYTMKILQNTLPWDKYGDEEHVALKNDKEKFWRNQTDDSVNMNWPPGFSFLILHIKNCLENTSSFNYDKSIRLMERDICEYFFSYLDAPLR